MPASVTSPPHNVEWLTGGGEMAEVIAGLDWSKTALGPLDSWPQSLRTTVSLCLASNFPIDIIWGDEHNQIYNDGYRVVCGAVHPRAMGEDYRITWASAWPAIGEPFERARAGETSYLENQRMFLERNGYPEETFFTFSLSPIRDETGKVVGLFHPVTETTTTILAARRTRALRDVADHTAHALDVRAAGRLLVETLASFELDLPFALLYLTSEDGTRADLVSRAGLAEGPMTPAVITLGEDASPWPLGARNEGRFRIVEGLAQRAAPFVAGPYPDPIQAAFVLTLRAAGVEQPLGFLVAGASPRLPLDEPYRAYAEMLGAAAATALGNARALAAERARAEALAQLDLAKTTFFSNVSHEFRTPLTLLLGPVEDLLASAHGELPDAARAELEVVRRNGLRLLKLVNSLLEFSRVEAGRTAATFSPLDLGTLTLDLASSFRSAIERAGLRFDVTVGELPAAVPVDRDMWEKIVLNLLSNAFKFTKGGAISVSLGTVGAFVELAVKDTGIGIPEREIGRVFQRFHRVEGADGRTHEGSGIGLALVHDLAELHGGTASLESEVGLGTTFFVRIPTSQAQPAYLEAPAAPVSRQMTNAFVEEALRWLPETLDPTGTLDARPRAPSANDTTRPRIVLADDNADMRNYVRRLLEPRYDVIAVANGVEALAAASQRPPDLLLSDLMMPEMDGAELVRRLRSDDRLRAIPVILLSARAGEEATAEGLELGADDYLTKPFAATELLARVAGQIKMANLRTQVAEQQAAAEHLRKNEALLEEHVRARDEFLAIASHELRTPLTSLRMQVQIAERALVATPEQPLPQERYVKLVNVLTKQVGRLTSLVGDLLDVARIRSGQLSLKLGEADLVAVVADVLERLATQLANAETKVTLHAPPHLAGTWDAARLDQVVTNLVENAIKYAPEAPVEIDLHEEPSAALLTIRDFGPGIPPDLLHTIFDRFDRAGASRNVGGLGLGLFIAKQVVLAHRGSIVVESPSGGGARFVIRLPRAS